MSLKYFLVVLTAGLCLDASAVEPVFSGDKSPGKETEARPDKPGGHSIAPVVGYEPTYRFVFGAAYFYEQERFSFGTDFNLNFKKVYQLHANISQRIGEKFEYSFRTGVTKGFDPYYGEGGETDPAAFRRLWGINSNSKMQLTLHLSDIFSVGLFGDFRTHDEDPEEGEPFVREKPNERTGAAGLALQVDARPSKERPTDGFKFNVDVLYSPAQFSTLAASEPFAQIDGSFIVYKEIIEEVIPEVIAAFRLKGGYSLGTPSYMYKFRLGGSDELPGYHTNRFRGKQYYMQQTELRFPIWKMFGGAGFLGFGDATDSNFTNAKMAYGAEIRIGLPPDWVSKIRIDVGFGRDESGVFADFGQSF